MIYKYNIQPASIIDNDIMVLGYYLPEDIITDAQKMLDSISYSEIPNLYDYIDLHLTEI